MRRKLLLIIVLIFTFILLTFVLIFTIHPRFFKYVVSNEEWNQIQKSRKKSTTLLLENIQFNDYSLMIDNDNRTIYYSVVRSSNPYNPSIQFFGNQKKLKIAINQKITDDVLEKKDVLKVLLYDDQSYTIYSLVVTDYPILSIAYDEKSANKITIPIQLELFDNHVDSPRKYFKSDGRLRMNLENNTYYFSLIKESLGHNKRENPISIFGMDPQDEYMITYAEDTSKNDKYVQLFVNFQYKGIYSLEEGRGVFEKPHRENQKK